MNNKALAKNNIRYFYYIYLIFLIIGSIFLLFIPYGEIILSVNSIANPTLDVIAIFLTKFGLGVTMGILTLIFLFIRYYYALASLISLAFTGIFTGILKKIIFKGLPRPTAYFNKDLFHHLIPGFDYHDLNTFPSGHSMTAFAIVLLLAVAIDNKWWSLILPFGGLLVASTRVYLLQHFFLDIYAGSVFGVACTLLGLYFAKLLFKNDERLMNKSLRDLKFF